MRYACCSAGVIEDIGIDTALRILLYQNDCLLLSHIDDRHGRVSVERMVEDFFHLPNIFRLAVEVGAFDLLLEPYLTSRCERYWSLRHLCRLPWCHLLGLEDGRNFL